MLSILLLSLLRLHSLLHLKLVRHVTPLLRRRAAVDLRHPLLNLRIRLCRHSRPLRPIDPAEARQVRNRILAADEPEALTRGLLGLETIIQHFVEPFRLRLVAVDSVVDFGRGIPVEVVRLALHGSDPGLHPGYPFDYFPVFVAVVGETEVVLFIVFAAEVEQDAAAFEEAFLFPRGLVYDCGDAAVCFVVVRCDVARTRRGIRAK